MERNMDPIKLIIADDHKLFAEGIRLLLSAEKKIVVTGLASNGHELLRLIDKEPPQVVLMDINMPLMNGIEASKNIRDNFPGIKIIILSMHDDKLFMDKIKTIGISGYLLKNVDKEELLTAIAIVTTGGSYFPEGTPAISKDYSLDLEDPVSKFNLTKRELEIIRMVRSGKSSREIAAILNISFLTVSTHRKNIVQKIGSNLPNSILKFAVQCNI